MLLDTSFTTPYCAPTSSYRRPRCAGVLGDVMRRRYSWYRSPLISWDGGEWNEATQPVGSPAELRAVERGTGVPADLELGCPPEAEEDAAEEAWSTLRDADPRLSALFDEEAGGGGSVATPQARGGSARVVAAAQTELR